MTAKDARHAAHAVLAIADEGRVGLRAVVDEPARRLLRLAPPLLKHLEHRVPPKKGIE